MNISELGLLSSFPLSRSWVDIIFLSHAWDESNVTATILCACGDVSVYMIGRQAAIPSFPTESKGFINTIP